MARAGTYIRINFSNNDTEEKKKETKKRPRRKNEAPILSKYAEHISDPFWKEVFERAGAGRFPKNFSFYEGKLVFKKGTKVFNLPLEGDNVVAAISFFRKHGNLISPKEIEEVEMQMKQQEKKAVNYGWGDFNKQDKIQLLTNFAHRLADEKKIDYRTVLSLLHVGLNFKYFDKEHVKIKNMQIDNISNLSYDKENKGFYFMMNGKVTKKRRE